MSLQENSYPCLIVKCDGCGLANEVDNHIPHYESKAHAYDELMDYGWTVWKDMYWHEDCVPACCCGDLYGEHDYGMGPCEVTDSCVCNQFHIQKHDGDEYHDKETQTSNTTQG